MRELIIGTAGHIDHGKTTLVKALTGIDADRLAEEKARGITIDIGFAHSKMGDYRVGFIDVPGHEKFVKNMLAGIGGIELLLLVIGADESIMPQTVEHFEICRLLGISRGIIVLTKRNSVDEVLLELVEVESRELVEGSFLENAPILAVDSLSGEGIEELRGAILDQLRRLDWDHRPQQVEARPFQMPVDRVFSVKGFGTVVTGTAKAGRISVDEELEIQPSGLPTRVRTIEIFGEPTESAEAGQRTAINLVGIERRELQRGHFLVTPGTTEAQSVFDTRLFLLESAPRPLKERDPLRFHLGSGEFIGRAYPLGGLSLAPGEEAFVQIRLDNPSLAFPGDRFVIRSYSPLETIGGGLILQNQPRRRKRKDLPELQRRLGILADSLEQVPIPLKPLIQFLVEDAGAEGVTVDQLVKKSGFHAKHILEAAGDLEDLVQLGKDSPLLLLRRELEKQQKKALEVLQQFHDSHPLASGITKEEWRRRALPAQGDAHFQHLMETLLRQGHIEPREGTHALCSVTVSLTAEQEELQTRILDLFRGAKLQPPEPGEVFKRIDFPPNEVQSIFYFLVERGKLVRVAEDVFLTPEQLDSLQEVLRDHFKPGDRFSVADFKDIFDLSRKFAIPLLEWLDRERVTRRSGNQRIFLPKSADRSP